MIPHPTMPPPRSRCMRHIARAAAAFVTAIGPILAQHPPGAPMPVDLGLDQAAPASGPGKVRWQTGQQSLQAGDFAAARRHLAEALEFHPSASALLLDMALATRSDPAEGPLWAERFVRGAADAAGRLKLDGPTRKYLTPHQGFETSLAPWSELAALRAQAIAEVGKLAERYRATGKQDAPRAVLVRWASELLLELGLGAPAPLAAAAPQVARVQAAFVPDHEAVCRALVRVMQTKPVAKSAGTAPTTGAPGVDEATITDRRVRAARILLGLHRQGGFEDLQGPKAPDLAKFAEEARDLLDELAPATTGAVKVWTIDELAALSPAEAEAFTQAHRDWRHPGTALSPTARYRIETTCGYHTLLGTARTIELHHTRLVSHYGSDPFLQRQGLVRVVPEAADLESEGAPYWWAGGFQAGDRTTIRFAWGRIPALGRTLTHELTHRFDGVLRPFLPSWYGEGHADWTGAHYGKMAETVFVENHLKVGTAAHTWYKGYGDKAKFTDLLAGKVDDYRDNYFAGYSLYAFLRSFPPAQPRYRSALDKFERNARGGQKDPVGFFTTTFCDGKEGRPSTFDELFADWQKFLRGCYDWLDDRKKPGLEWVAAYGPVDDESGPRVMDEPTWSWARTRAEPFFGQDHAAAATLLLHEAGDVDGAIAAGLWSTTVDGWRPDITTALAAELRASKHAEAAQAFGLLAWRHFPSMPSGAATLLAAQAPRTRAFLEALATRTQTLRDGAPMAARALASDHGRIGALLGLPPIALPNGPPALPRHLGDHGFAESSLTGYDDRRVAGLWFTTPEGDLHVGREKPRDGTGALDRHAHQRDAFVHTVAWQGPGAYVIRGRVHFTTSYASGAIVFGHTRRDRGLRLRFTSGDFDYATGRSERADRSGRVSFELLGMWERDGQMPAMDLSHAVEVKGSTEAPSFAFALHVRGPRVLVEIDGEARIRYSVHDGAPIEGQIGFATGMGAIRVQQPVVQRRDGEVGDLVTGLQLDRQPDVSLEELLLLPTRGIPLHENGTLVLWLPRVEGGEPQALDFYLPGLAKLLNTPHEHPQPWVLAVPKELPAGPRAAAAAALATIRAQPLPLVEHQVGEPLDGDAPWVLFVDAQGVLRAAAEVRDPKLHSRVTNWSRLLRAR